MASVEAIERASRYRGIGVLACLSQEHQLVVGNPVDNKSDNEDDESDNESRIIEKALTVLSRADKLGIDVRVEEISQEARERDPQGNFGLAVLKNQWSNQAPLQEMYDPQTEEDDVRSLIEVLSSEEVGQNKKDDTGNQIDDHVCNSRRYWQSPTATCMSSVRDGLEELRDEADYGQNEAEDHETEMDPETNIIVPCISDWTGLSVRVIGEEEVGDAIARAEASIARLWGGGGRRVAVRHSSVQWQPGLGEMNGSLLLTVNEISSVQTVKQGKAIQE